MPGFLRVARVLAQDAHRAARGCEQASEHFDGGGFARAIGAEKAVKLAGFHAQIKAVHGTQIAEAAGQSVGFDSKCHKDAESIVPKL